MELQNPNCSHCLSFNKPKMEVCKAEAIFRSCSTKPLFFNSSFTNRHSSLSLSHQGLHAEKCFSSRSTKSDDASSGSNQFLNANSDKFKNVEDRRPYQVHEFGKPIRVENPKDEPVSLLRVGNRLDEEYEEGSLLDIKNRIAEFADELNLKFDSKDSYSVVLYGSSAIVALYLATAVIGAMDSIPVFPKLMEVVGLGYSVWFTNRYLLFKNNRDELAAKIEELKQRVLGSENQL